MYTPQSFDQSDPDILHSFIETHSFATLISAATGTPSASHLPLLIDRDQNQLLGHFARANPHWKECAGAKVLAIFHGPHDYITPTWYAENNLVPTWNYVVTHVEGVLELVEDPEETYSILRKTVQFYEADRRVPWSMDDSEPELIEKLISSIVSFRIAITSIQGKWKLNQNHPRERRERVIEGLLSRPQSKAESVAQLMEQELLRDSAR